MDRSWSQTERFSLTQAHYGGIHHLVISRKKAKILCWLVELAWMCVCVCVYLWCRGSKQPMVRNRRGLLVANTKPLLCNQLSVKSPLCGPHKAPQRQGAGGWGQSAATQLWAEPTHPSSIWALLISVATWPLLPPGPGTMEALSRPFCCKCFQSPFLAQILNISLGLLCSAPFLSLRF